MSLDKTKITITIFAGVIFFFSSVTGESIQDNLFRWLSWGMSATVLILLIYDRWIWKWWLFRKISEHHNIPCIYGTWKGKLKFDKDSDGKPGEVDVYLSVNQTLSSISVMSFVSTSESYSLTAKLKKVESGKLQLIYLYRSTVPYGRKESNRPHDGAAVLDIVGKSGLGISGSYFTDRGGTGTIKLTDYDQHAFQNFEEAVRGKYKAKK